MGDLAVQTLDRLKQSNELRVNAGITSMDDTRVKKIIDNLTRTELELAGIDSSQFSMDAILNSGAGIKSGASMDDASRFTARQLEDFDRTLREVEYGDVDILKHLNVTSIPVGATQHTFMLNDVQGDYKRITGSARDLPTSHISGEESTIKIEMGGGSIEWNQQETDAYDFAGIDYNVEKVRAVRRAYLQDIKDITVFGNENCEGLMTYDIDEAQVADSVKNPNNVTGIDLKYWINKTGREIVNDITKARQAIHVGTEGRWGGPLYSSGLEGNTQMFTLEVPLQAFNALMDTYMTENYNPQTTLDYLLSDAGKRATAVEKIVVILDFDSAFNGGTDSGFMLTPNDSNAYSFVKPLDLTPKPVQFVGLSMVIPYYDYFGGMKLIRNKACIRRRSIQAV